MRTEQLNYELPEDRIARFPTVARDGARMLVVKEMAFEDSTIAEWPNLVPPESLLVLNDTRVFKARLLGHRRPMGGKVELLLLEPLVSAPSDTTHRHWRAIGRANRPLVPETVVDFGGLTARILGREESGELQVELESEGSFEEALDRVGHVPIPPYLRREDDSSDRDRYQTVYARHSGSIAAPTAGLHLSPDILQALHRRGVEIGFTTLHVGMGTFKPVVAEDLDEHDMHTERFEVSGALAGAISNARARKAPVVAVGTTVVRALESAADPQRVGHVIARAGTTRLLIQPGYSFRVADALLTNFHMPKSTLLALVGAFIGLERTLRAYHVALERDYRFLSYGDAMWIPQRI